MRLDSPSRALPATARRGARNLALFALLVHAWTAPAQSTPPPATTTVIQQIDPADSGLRWANHAGIPFGQPLYPAILDATAAVPGTFYYAPTDGTYLTPGAHTLTVHFVPASSNYQLADATIPFVIAPSTAQSFDLSVAPESRAAEPFTLSGTPVSVHLLLTPMLPVEQSIALTCSVPPAHTSCLFSPGSVYLGKKPVDITLTFPPSPSASNNAHLPASATIAVLLFCCLLPRRRTAASGRNRLRASVCIVILLGLSLSALTGCGAQSSAPVIHITAASSFESHAVDVRVL